MKYICFITGSIKERTFHLKPISIIKEISHSHHITQITDIDGNIYQYYGDNLFEMIEKFLSNPCDHGVIRFLDHGNGFEEFEDDGETFEEFMQKEALKTNPENGIMN